jgi:stage II sporulation protein AB (anti-sigma F factor)
MELLLYQYALQVKVCDDGVGIADVQQAMEPEFTTGEEHLGLGFAFMSSFMDDVQVDSRLGCGTTVTMLKRIHQ